MTGKRLKTRTSVSAGKRKLKIQEALPGGREGKGEGHVARLSPVVGVYKCLSLIVGFAVTVAIWPREVVSCRDFILRAVLLFGPCRLSEFTLAGPHTVGR